MVSVVCLILALFSNYPRSRFPLLRFASIVLSFCAFILSVSRTGVVALATGAAVVLVGGLFSRRRTGSGQGRSYGPLYWMGSLLIVFLAAASPILEQRNSSSGGQASAEYRSEIVREASDMMVQHALAGTGPGTGSFYFASTSGLQLENSWLQLYLSLGLLSASLIVIGVVAGLLLLIRKGHLVISAALASICVSLAGFNALDNYPALLFLASPLILVGAYSSGAPDSITRFDRRIQAVNREPGIAR
ncbi:O-antigen ligase family protein [Gordonia sp. Z-3]|uniref:O-antigen ligase family protein n=1 Tax=Gordonia sp. Z-3 TaxID=3115408 RepID=UPI003FA59393